MTKYRISASPREGFNHYWRGTPPRPWPRSMPGVLVEVHEQDDDPDPQNLTVPGGDTPIRIGRKSFAEIQGDSECRVAATGIGGSSVDVDALRAQLAEANAKIAAMTQAPETAPPAPSSEPEAKAPPAEPEPKAKKK